jgi:subtilase family serine protease
LPLRRTSQLTAFLCFVFVTIGVAANAQTSEQASHGNGEPSLVVLQHTKHPLVIEANALGRVEAGRRLQRMLLVLSPSVAQEAALQRLLDDQQNPKSPNYHHSLTAAEFATRFGASDAALQSVLAWLQGEGLAVERVAASKRWVEFSGTSSQVENAFHTELKYYRENGKTVLANSTDLAVPANIARMTRGPLSLNGFGREAPVHELRGSAGRDAHGKKTVFTPNLTSVGTTTYMAPQDFAAIYNTKGLLNSGVDGSGISIAVVAQSQVELTDVRAFRQIFGLKPNEPNVLLSGPDPGIASQADSEEAVLDMEWAGAVAPGATVKLVVAGSTDTTSGVDLAAAYAIDNQVSPIVSDTYRTCEQDLGSSGNAFYNALWQQAAAEGITVLVSSGDSGSAGCDSSASLSPTSNGLAVNGVASTPYNIAVGLTEFADRPLASSYSKQADSTGYTSVIGYIPETAWNETCDPTRTSASTNCILANGRFTRFASAGGTSHVYPKPSWQSGPGVPADNARDLPDVALSAGHNETVFCTSLGGTPCQINGPQDVVGLTLVGGASVSTPALAGILALIEQRNGAWQGQVNDLLYKLARTAGNSCNSSDQSNPSTSNSCVFYDITAGNNEVPCAGGSPGCSSTQTGANGFTTGHVAGPGYDLVTGLGSVNATNLAVAWNNATPLQTPPPSFTVSVSPNPLAFAAGTTGSGTVTITPSGGFTGTVTLACASGGTFLPAGYSCAFGLTNVVVNNAVATTTLSFTPSSSSATSGSVKRASAMGLATSFWGAGLGAGLLLAILAFGVGAPKNSRNFLAACGLILSVTSVVWGCGGEGSGGGAYATTTTIVSTNLDVPFNTPVTFTVTVKPSGAVTPSGLVQLYDNGQVYGSAVKVSAGIATYLATTLPVGVHNLAATYGGDAHTQASTSAPIAQMITGQVPLQISGTNNDNTETVSFTVVVI